MLVKWLTSYLTLASINVNFYSRINSETLELRIFWIFPANPGVQTKFCGIAQINGKFIKQVNYSFMKGRTT